MRTYFKIFACWTPWEADSEIEDLCEIHLAWTALGGEVRKQNSPGREVELHCNPSEGLCWLHRELQSWERPSELLQDGARSNLYCCIDQSLDALERGVATSRNSSDDAVCIVGRYLKNISSIIPNSLVNKSFISEGRSSSHNTAPKIPF